MGRIWFTCFFLLGSAVAQEPVLTAKLAQQDPEFALQHLGGVTNELEREKALRAAFVSALAQGMEIAEEFLPLVMDRPWLPEINFGDACTLAADIEGDQPAVARRLVLAPGLRNPALALRERERYLSLTFGKEAFAQFVSAAPAEVVRLASGDSKPAGGMRAAMLSTDSAEAKLLVEIAEMPGLDLPTRARVATLDPLIASGRLTMASAVAVARSTPRYFGAIADLRVASSGAQADALDRALEEESLVLCREAQESLGRVAAELSGFRGTDLYLLLAYGRAEATPPVFTAVFDRSLLPKLKAEGPRAKSLLDLLQRTGDLELRDFAAGAIAAHRFDAFVPVVGAEILGKLAGSVDRAQDPLKEAIRLAEVLDATANQELLRQMAAIVVAEYRRCAATGNRSGKVLYGLLAARLIDGPGASAAVEEAGGAYRPFLKSSGSLPLSEVFDASGQLVERYFFYDDEDGVASFDSFRRSYANDAAWKVEDRGEYVHLIGQGEGRRIEIFANVPIDGHLPANRARQYEYQRRQETMAAAMKERGLVPRVWVHRGHSFWVERTLTYLTDAARLVILGSCGGTNEIHSVLATSHEAQVIATRGVGAAEVNDPILKALNDRLLSGGPMLEWKSFWQAQGKALGRTGLFRDYLAPDQDPGSVFLAGYYRAMDSVETK